MPHSDVDPGFVATLCVGSEQAILDVRSLDDAREGTQGWQRFSGVHECDLHRAHSFLQQLVALGAWDLPDCRTNTIHGLLWTHVIASGGKDHCIAMPNPHLHANPVYVRMIRLYSETFFEGVLSEWIP
jgi:hypothetical protein